MREITLTRPEGFDILSLLLDAVEHLVQTRVLTLAVLLQDGVDLLGDKLFRDLPPGPGPFPT